MEIIQLFTTFKEAPETAKIVVIILQFIVILAMAIWKIHDKFVKRDLRSEIERQKKEAAQELASREEKADRERKHLIEDAQRERTLLLDKAQKERENLTQDSQKALQQALADQQSKLKVEADQLHETISQLREENAKLKVHLEEQDNQFQEMQSEIAELQKERSDVEKRINRLDTVWSSATTEPSVFQPKELRKTRFFSFLNLKGGVGKTTLTANTAAALAAGLGKSQPSKILLVDLDFQGTLSNTCVSAKDLNYQRRNKNTSDRLLDASEDIDALFNQLIVPMDENENVHVIVAREDLDRADFLKQASLAIGQGEVRFNFRALFHSNAIFGHYDYVFFDCPPRLTTSSVNALFASDYIIIPTSLVAFDIDAIARTLAVTNELKKVDENFAKVIAIIANRTYREGTIDKHTTQHERQALLRLRQTLVAKGHGENLILNSLIPGKNPIANAALDGKTYASTSDGGKLFAPMIEELLSRIHRPAAPQLFPTIAQKG